MSINHDEYNRGGLIAFVGATAFCLLFFVYVSFIHPGVDLKEVTEELKQAEQTMAAGGGAPAVDVTKIEKPWLDSADIVAHGKTVFANNCAICHGNEGKGDGPAGAALQPPPRNLVEGKWKQGGTSAELFTTLEKGIPGSSMAPFGHLPKTDRWALVQFIRSITQNKAADDAAKLEQFAASAK